MTGFLLSYIWLWQDAFPGSFAVCAAGYFGIGAAGQVARRESLRDVGLRLDNVGASTRDAARVVLPIVAGVAATGAALGSLRRAGPLEVAADLGLGWLWAVAQQYGLLAFFFRRLVDVMGRGTASVVAGGATFALFHLPNPFLVPFTFGAGMLSCWLYRRQPNLLVLGAMHTVISFALSHALPPALTHELRVGPGFWTPR